MPLVETFERAQRRKKAYTMEVEQVTMPSYGHKIQ